jgi:hypothetical protein
LAPAGGWGKPAICPSSVLGEKSELKGRGKKKKGNVSVVIIKIESIYKLFFYTEYFRAINKNNIKRFKRKFVNKIYDFSP